MTCFTVNKTDVIAAYCRLGLLAGATALALGVALGSSQTFAATPARGIPPRLYHHRAAQPMINPQPLPPYHGDAQPMINPQPLPPRLVMALPLSHSSGPIGEWPRAAILSVADRA